MSGAVLLTGATGFLGMDLFAELLERERETIVLVRADGDEQAQARLEGVIARLWERRPPAAAQVRALAADLQSPGLGLSAAAQRLLACEVEAIVHCAASISFGIDLPTAREINVGGVRRIIELARHIASEGSLRRLLHVSTAYVCGRHQGRFGEEELELGQEFRNPYERSKQEGERLLRAARDLPVVVARPSIVVGHSRSGWTSAFNVIYGPMRAYERGMLDEVPARPESIIDFVPVDYVTDGLLCLLDHPVAHGTYHLVAGEQALSAAELVQVQSELLGRPPMRLLASGAEGGLPAGIEAYAPYLDIRCSFDDARARLALTAAGIEAPAPGDYFPRLIEYARATRWGKRPVSRQAALGFALP